MCVLLTDPNFGCASPTCTACVAGSKCCGGKGCTYTPADPTHCGNCTQECAATEWCSNSMCTCRPGLVNVGGTCLDPATNPNDCGGVVCTGKLCQNGVCVTSC